MRVRSTPIGAALVIVATAATAQTPAAPLPSAGVATSPAPTRPTDAPSLPSSRRSPYTDTTVKGHAAMAAGNFAAAREAYRAAVTADPRDPLALYFLGEAQTAEGELLQAEASFASAIAVATGRDDVHARLLFVVADLRERQGNWAEASRAWEAYRQFLTAHPDVKGYAANASERAKIVSGRTDLDAKYATVKQRIELRQKAPAAAPSEGPTGAAKNK